MNCWYKQHCYLEESNAIKSIRMSLLVRSFNILLLDKPGLLLTYSDTLAKTQSKAMMILLVINSRCVVGYSDPL